MHPCSPRGRSQSRETSWCPEKAPNSHESGYVEFPSSSDYQSSSMRYIRAAGTQARQSLESSPARPDSWRLQLHRVCPHSPVNGFAPRFRIQEREGLLAAICVGRVLDFDQLALPACSAGVAPIDRPGEPQLIAGLGRVAPGPPIRYRPRGSASRTTLLVPSSAVPAAAKGSTKGRPTPQPARAHRFPPVAVSSRCHGLSATAISPLPGAWQRTSATSPGLPRFPRPPLRRPPPRR